MSYSNDLTYGATRRDVTRLCGPNPPFALRARSRYGLLHRQRRRKPPPTAFHGVILLASFLSPLQYVFCLRPSQTQSSDILSSRCSLLAELENASTPERAPLSQGGPRAPTSPSWIFFLLLSFLSLCSAQTTDSPGSGARDGVKNAKEVYVYSGSVSQSPFPGGFELLSTSDKHVTIKRKASSTTTSRPAVAPSTEAPVLAKEALNSVPPSVKVEGRPNHGAFVHFPSGESHNLISSISSTVKPPDIDYGSLPSDILGEAIDQEAFASSHGVISECDGDECCPGPHCTKDLICNHGRDCYYVPHKKASNHYPTYQPPNYYGTPRPQRKPPKHRPYNPTPKPQPITKPPRPTKTKISSHYSSKPSLHQGSYRPNHVTVIKPAASNIAVKTKKPPGVAPLKHGLETGAIANLIEDGVVSTLEPRFGKKKHFRKKKKFLQKYMMPLLMAYKMMFIVLVPVMVKTMMMVVSTSGFTGFFIALFGAAVTFHYYHSKINSPPTAITLSPPPPTEPTKVMKVIKYLPLPQPMMPPQPMPPPPPLPPPPPPPAPPAPPQYPEEPYGGYNYPNYYDWMDKRKSKKRKRHKGSSGSSLPNLTLFRR